LETSLFPTYTDYRFQIFLQTGIGQLFKAVPFAELAKPYKRYKNLHPQGRKAVFGIEGGWG